MVRKLVYYWKLVLKGIIGLATLSITSWYGSQIDTSGFLTNILAGIFGIVITLLFIDTLLDYHHKKQKRIRWAKVRSVTENSLNLLMTSITTSLHSWLHNSIYSMHPPKNSEIFKKIKQYSFFDLQEAAFKKNNKLASKKIISNTLTLYNEVFNYFKVQDIELSKIDFEKFIKYHNTTFQDSYIFFIRPFLDRISDDLIPRILEFSEDQKLIDELIKFDDNIHMIEMDIKWNLPKSEMGKMIFPQTLKIGIVPDTKEKIDFSLIVLSHDLVKNINNVYSVFSSSE